MLKFTATSIPSSKLAFHSSLPSHFSPHSNFHLFRFFSHHQTFSHLTRTVNTVPSIAYFAINSSLDSFINQNSSSILFPYQNTVPSIILQHPHSSSLRWLIPSVTCLAHTHNEPSHFHQSVNPFKRKRGVLVGGWSREVSGCGNRGAEKEASSEQNVNASAQSSSSN